MNKPCVKNKAAFKIFCVSAAASLFLAGCGVSGSDSTLSSAGGEYSEVGTQNRYTGVVVSQGTVKVEKDSSLTVGEVLVSVGDEVTEGQVLFTYDTDESSLAVEKAELEIEQLENSIKTNESQIKELKTQQKSAGTSTEKLEYTLEIQELEITISETEYNIKTKKAELESLKTTLENTEVKSEINGVVTAIASDSGSSSELEGGDSGTGEGEAFITLTRTGQYRIIGTVSELNVASLYEGAPVVIRSRADENETWSGTISEIKTDQTAESGTDEDSGVSYSMSGDGMTSDGEASSSASKYTFYVDMEDSTGLMMGQHVYIELEGE